MPEDRPDAEVIANDHKFDAWLESMERLHKQRVAAAKTQRAKAALA
jgi:hypothetical protein